MNVDRARPGWSRTKTILVFALAALGAGVLCGTETPLLFALGVGLYLGAIAVLWVKGRPVLSLVLLIDAVLGSILVWLLGLLIGFALFGIRVVD